MGDRLPAHHYIINVAYAEDWRVIRFIDNTAVQSCHPAGSGPVGPEDGSRRP